ncbi:MAG: GNAT family N-acetyltransferase [Acidobacteriia bacterium]|nr:GNAT family N-acetyltransferase [Terriglobia bacterium]
MIAETAEISVRGKWVRTPALTVDNHAIVVLGTWLKTAVIRDEEWLETPVTDPALCLESLNHARRSQIRADIFTFTQKLPAIVPQFSYPLEWDSIAVANTESFGQWWERVPQETRKNVRRAERRGVVVECRQFDDNLVRGIMEVSNETPIRQGRAYPHYGKTFEQVRKDHSAFLDRSDFITAYFGDELVGFLKLVYRGGVASILQLLAKVRHSDKRPANALLAKAVECCAGRGIAQMTYGMFNYGRKRNASLTEFKVRNGFAEVLVPRYYVPLTPWGALCMKLKVHNGLIGLLPNPLIQIGLTVRAAWYRHV